MFGSVFSICSIMVGKRLAACNVSATCEMLRISPLMTFSTMVSIPRSDRVSNVTMASLTIL